MKTSQIGEAQSSKVELDFPPELDVRFYRGRNPNMSGWTDEQVTKHFVDHGQSEGRIGSVGATRRHWMTAFPETLHALEIGPFCNPFLRGSNIKYLDLMDSEGLQARWDAVERHEPRTAPPIHFVSPTGDLSMVDEVFDLVFSSHCIEHQIDLVAHLRGVSETLQPDGVYFLFIPDKRYCFDHFLPETTIADVLDAVGRPRDRHTLRDVILHRAKTTHNQVARHWQGDHADPGYGTDNANRVARALSAYLYGEFVDMHAWQFIPERFRSIAETLFQLGLTDLQPTRVYNTPRDRAEFVAVLKKTSTRVTPQAEQLLALRYEAK
ncbi:MAG: methyltransferase domain-containing protein [Pseudomonadota bacterium]